MTGNTCFLCKTTWNQKVSMFSPPSDEYLKGEWDAACGIEIPRHSRLCAKHFTAENFSRYGPARKRLLPDAVPSLNLTVNQRKSGEIATVDNEKYCRKARATLQQLLYYISFTRKHPEMLRSKYRAVKELWAELAQALNEKNGVQRTPEKWRENLNMWRAKLRCRARQGTLSGIPEFDRFAENDFGLDAENQNFTEDGVSNTNDEPPIKKVKLATRVTTNNGGTDKVRKRISSVDELNAENLDVLLSYADVEVKVEIDEDDSADHLLNRCTSIPEYESEADTNLQQEAEPDVKTEIDISDTPMAPQEPEQQQKHKLKQKPVVHRITLPITSDMPSSSVHAKSADATPPPPQVQNVNAAPEVESETYFVIHSTTTNQSNSNAPENEDFNIEEITQTTSSAPSPPPQQPKKPDRKRQHNLNQMYETVLKTIQRREERTDEILEALKGLTAAVTQLANSVKRLEEKLT